MYGLRHLIFAVSVVYFIFVSAQVTVAIVEETETKVTWADIRRQKDKCGPGYYPVCTPCEMERYKPKSGWQRRCADCDDGSGTLEPGSALCIRFCKPGQKFLSADRKKPNCTKCEPGTYMDVSGLNKTCKPCGPHMTTLKPGAISRGQCVCDAGYESSKDGNGSCRPCQEGKVKIKASAEGCEDCPNNKTTLMDGAKDKITECVKHCEEGKQYNWTSGGCDPCEKGFFKANRSSRETCIPCPINTVTRRKGADRCEVECGKGYEWSGGGCRKCPWGTYKTKIGNDIPCTSCTSETGPVKVTLEQGASERTKCYRKPECVATALEDLKHYYGILQAFPFKEDDNIISALSETCFGSLSDNFKKILSSFQSCPDLKEVILPEVTIGGRTYGHEKQRELILSIVKFMNNSRGDYCEYLRCATNHSKEITKCKAAMKDDGQRHLHFCSEEWRAGAACVMLNVRECPPLQFLPSVAEELNLNGIKPRDIAEKNDILSLCAGAELIADDRTDNRDETFAPGEEQGGVKPGKCPRFEEGHMAICTFDCKTDGDCTGSDKCCSNGCGNVCMKPADALAECQSLLDPFLSIIESQDLVSICHSQGDISSALSCFGENGIEDEFFQQYADFTVILEPYLGPTEGMSLKSIIDFMTNFCPILESGAFGAF